MSQCRENGAGQTAVQLFWSDGTTDTIQFRSDVHEPPLWMLLLIAFAALGVRGAKPGDLPADKIIKYRSQRSDGGKSQQNTGPETNNKDIRFNPDSAVEGETKSKAQVFRCEGNGSVPLRKLQVAV